MRHATRKFAGLAAVILLGGALFLAAGCSQEAPSDSNGEIPRNVRVLTLGQETVAEFLEISGPVAPVRGTDLSAQESGPVV